jgi:lipopolysaccharide/colanic/teichoic acid biosynthesis glycosyltransferase
MFEIHGLSIPRALYVTKSVIHCTIQSLMNSSRIFLLLVGDIISFAIALIVMLVVDTRTTPGVPLLSLYITAFITPLFLSLISFYIADLYDIRRSIPSPRTIGRFVIGIVLFSVLTVIFFYRIPSFRYYSKIKSCHISHSRSLPACSCGDVFSSFLFARTFTRTILFIGEDPEISELAEELRIHRHVGTSVGILKDINSYDASIHHADLIVLSRSIGTQDVERLSHITTPLMTVRGAFEEMFGKTPLSLLSQEEAFTLLEHTNKQSNTVAHRMFEILMSSLVLIVTSPFLILATIARLIEDGRPLFIGQTRVGKNGTQFTLYKFRSMKALAPDGSAEVAGPQWAEKKDPRITPVGRILRKTHIDELPQMWNIIRGDLALVGPRAERPEFVDTLEKAIPYYALRHSIKPGFTGWAQVRYRYARTIDDSKEKFEYDLYYLKNKNIFLDIGIIAKTIQIIFTH